MCGADPSDVELSVELPTESDTESLGRLVGSHLESGDVVCLVGDLGAGKTTFVRGVHSAMGCAGRVRSPSFATMIEYSGKPPLYHFDLYRYESAGEAFLHEFEDWLFGDGVSVIEWSERLGSRLPKPHLGVRFEMKGEGRTAFVRGEGMRWHDVVTALAGDAR